MRATLEYRETSRGGREFGWDIFSAVAVAILLAALAVGMKYTQTWLVTSCAVGAVVCVFVRLRFGGSNPPPDPPRIPLSQRRLRRLRC